MKGVIEMLFMKHLFRTFIAAIVTVIGTLAGIAMWGELWKAGLEERFEKVASKIFKKGS